MSIRATLTGLALCAATTAGRQSPAPPPAAQTPPATEIYLAPFSDAKGKTIQIAIFVIDKEGVSVGKPINITNNPGYDNQPFFLPDSSGVLFSSRRDGQQNDIYRYDIGKKTVTQLTHTPENEYSPTVTPDGKTFSTVRGDEQRLWRSIWTAPTQDSRTRTRARSVTTSGSRPIRLARSFLAWTARRTRSSSATFRRV
jgi:dipeptidyl aminopeptidase/acylaminoacyl peptidase